jgi:hypothetical protein
MKNDPASDLAAQRLANAIRDYTPKHPSKFQTLLPLKDAIAELRAKGASYATIADILRNINVPVACDTVFRFCHEVLGEPMTRRRKRRKPPVRVLSERAQEKSHEDHSTNKSKKADSRPVSGRKDTNGPRIADPNNI